MKLQNKIENFTSSMLKINRKDEIVELSIENNTQVPLISYFDESNLFLHKGKLLKSFYSKNDNAEKDFKFFNRTLKIVLLTTTVLLISLIDFGTNSDLISNLLFLQILLFVIYLLYFFYYHPSFKDILPALFGEKKIIIYENGIEINVDLLEGDLRYIRYIDVKKIVMNKELKELSFNFGKENIVIKLNEFNINSTELDEIENLIRL